MIVLASTDILRLVTSAATAVDVVAAWADNAAASFTPGVSPTTIAAAATTTVVAAPAASTTRNVSHLSVRARGGANTVTLQFFNGAAFELISVALGAGERLEYENGRGFSVYDVLGFVKTLTNASFALARVRVNGTDQTQRAAINQVDTATVSWTGTDDGVNLETELRASVVAGSIGAAQQAQMAANTIKGNPTAALANESDIALAVQTALFRGSANIVAGAAAAGQFLGRSLAGGDLSFQLLPGFGVLLRAPQFITATNPAFAHPTGMRLFVAFLLSGGGGGGGAAATAGAGGNGGNGGSWGFKTFTSISGTSNITIGAAGTVGSGVAGGNGGTTSLVHNAVTGSVAGGVGGALFAGAATLARNAANAANGAAVGMDYAELGTLGQRAFRNVANVLNIEGGDGGSSPYGNGGFGNNFGALGAGDAASGRGAGGGGAAAPSATAQTGGAATAGLAILWEFG